MFADGELCAFEHQVFFFSVPFSRISQFGIWHFRQGGVPDDDVMPGDRKINLSAFDFRIGKHFLDEVSEQAWPFVVKSKQGFL